MFLLKLSISLNNIIGRLFYNILLKKIDFCTIFNVSASRWVGEYRGEEKEKKEERQERKMDKRR